MSDKRSSKQSQSNQQPSSSFRKYSNVSFEVNDSSLRKLSQINENNEDQNEFRLKRTTILTGNFQKKTGEKV